MSNKHKINWLMAVVFIAWVSMVVFLVLSNVRQAPVESECIYCSSWAVVEV